MDDMRLSNALFLERLLIMSTSSNTNIDIGCLFTCLKKLSSFLSLTPSSNNKVIYTFFFSHTKGARLI
jgi:hypothetical protein